MNVSDLWPRSAVELGVLSSAPLVRFFEKWERWAYRAADLVTCQTEGIQTGVQERLPGASTFLYPNGVDLDFFAAGSRTRAERSRYGVPEDATVVGYAGNFGRAQALEQVVDAADRLKHREDIWFQLVGAGPCREEVMAHAQRFGLERVVFGTSVPRIQMPGLLASWDLSVVPLADAPVFDGARPSKMFELFAAGLPFVFCGRGEGAQLADRSGGADIVPPEDPDALAAAIEALVDAGADVRMKRGEAARAFAVNGFDRQTIADRLEEKLIELLDERR
jgi:glycosyltransferase involved in cell wall biosynthesis